MTKRGKKAQPLVGESTFNPWNDTRLIAYYDKILAWHGYIRFLGLPHFEESPDVPIDRLYVEPSVSKHHIKPDLPLDKWPERSPALSMCAASACVVLLGDPGSGKSALVSWIAWQLSRPRGNAWTEQLGPIVPVPLVLRDLHVTHEVTWDALLDTFLHHPMASPLNREMLDELLAGGHVLILIDGIDEIGSVAVRTQLRKAVHEGMRLYPACCWLMTSRIVGYDEVPFDRAMTRLGRKTGGRREDCLAEALALKKEFLFEIAEARSEPPDAPVGAAESMAEVFYLAPFDDDQIRRFARYWQVRHETRQDEWERNAGELVEAIWRNEGTVRLARIPNLLTIMALIHRVRADLPHGRINLYNDIAEAYLDSIDKYRKLNKDYHQFFEFEDKKAWLARIGYAMQVRRAKEVQKAREKGGDSQSGEILVAEAEVLRWVRDGMRASGVAEQSIEREAQTFVHYIARRSGLFLPRAEKVYAFVHLSFQEYFAACYLKDKIMSLAFSEKITTSEQEEFPFDKEILDAYANDSCWHETMYLLFELLPKRINGPDKLAEWSFGKVLSLCSHDPAQGKISWLEQVRLLASLAVDPYCGFSEEKRKSALDACWRWELSVPLGWEQYNGQPRVAAILLSASLLPEVQQQVRSSFRNAFTLTHSKQLAFTGCEDLRDLSILDGVELNLIDTIVLSGCKYLTCLPDLSGLSQLKILSLSRCAGLKSLPDLSGLSQLKYLFLSGCTGHTCLPDLSGLSQLKILFLSGYTGLTCLPDLSGLSKLDRFFLTGCTDLTCLPDLSGLSKLEGLFLGGCTGLTCLPDLSGLSKLKSLNLTGCTGLTCLPDLSGLSKLKGLNLTGCTGLSSLSRALKEKPGLTIVGYQGEWV